MRTLRLPMPLPGLNDIIDAKARSKTSVNGKRWDAYQPMKKKWGQTVALYARNQDFEKVTEPSHFEFEWMEAYRKRDPDNISAGGRKIILDALQECGLLENDNATWVLSFADTFSYGKDVGVVLTVK